jgi:hypothetical protein
MAKSAKPEILCIRGHIDRAGVFTPRRCYSTTVVRKWPRAEGSDVALELLDAHLAVLHRTLVEVKEDIDCGSLEARRLKVTGYIGLSEGAKSIQLVQHNLVMWQRGIPERPSLKVRLARRATRKAPAEIRCRFSRPSDGAFLQVLFQWGRNQHQVLGYAAPREALKFNLADLPGGKRCRFVVQYSNGLRSVGDATDYFSLPLFGPKVSILRPRPGITLLPGQPLELQGQVLDPERPGGPHPAEELRWWLDNEEIGCGPVAGVVLPPAGRHRVTLRYLGAPNALASVNVAISKHAPEGSLHPDEWPDLPSAY